MNPKQIAEEEEAMRVFQLARNEHSLASSIRKKESKRFKAIDPRDLTVGEFHAEMRSKKNYSEACKKRQEAEYKFNMCIREIRNEPSIIPHLPEGMKLEEAQKLIDKSLDLLMDTPSATDLAKIDEIKHKLNPERIPIEQLGWAKDIIAATRAKEEKERKAKESEEKSE